MDKKVLVIDDNELNLKLVKTILVKEGFTVFAARDAETGMDMARREIPHLILMDLQLPGVDGLDAVRSIREDSALDDTPVIAITAYAMKKDRDRALESGCVDYITKPFMIDDFLKTVRRYT
jgi:two-component system cell cycle response regulator DivK